MGGAALVESGKGGNTVWTGVYYDDEDEYEVPQLVRLDSQLPHPPSRPIRKVKNVKSIKHQNRMALTTATEKSCCCLYFFFFILGRFFHKAIASFCLS